MTTEDTVYQGRVLLVQPEQGFRAGTDSLLLAAALACRPGGEALVDLSIFVFSSFYFQYFENKKETKEGKKELRSIQTLK